MINYSTWDYFNLKNVEYFAFDKDYFTTRTMLNRNLIDRKVAGSDDTSKWSFKFSNEDRLQGYK